MVAKKYNIFKKPPEVKRKRKNKTNRFLPHELDKKEGKVRFNPDGSLLRYSYIGKEKDFFHMKDKKESFIGLLLDPGETSMKSKI